MMQLHTVGRDSEAPEYESVPSMPEASGRNERPVSFDPGEARQTVLIAGSDERTARLAEWAERAGLRCLGTVTLDGLSLRLESLISVDLVLADLRDATLEGGCATTLAARHIHAQCRLAVLCDLAAIDSALAWFDGPDTEFLCDPETSDIVRLLVMAAHDARRTRGQARLHDPCHDDEGNRIDQLSEEVRRLAKTINRLAGHADGSGEPMAANRHHPPGLQDGARHGELTPPARRQQCSSRTDEPSQAELRALLRARRLRDQFLPADLFADPAWDMILDLMAARIAGQRVSVSSLCIAAAVPTTTALRWIRQLTDRGVFARIDDPADGRRVFIELTDEAAAAVVQWMNVIRRSGGLLVPSPTA